LAVYEIKSGAHGINISPVSPWNQSEIVTSGRFKIVDVKSYDTGVWDKWAHKNVIGYRVILEQIGVWDVDPSEFSGKPVKTSYAQD
jgi:hypothetical protein